ncbi:glycosyltransferase family 2 protein [Olsenella massiliensis]|uniref:glycosyltransferase family 2 protein n=1 Tax=Olsenella massiliensis TaxID=1622075 RepID=UPI000AA34A8E|nr:glycosyltransferase family 2 protein [Olsenella massiliensis]
MPVSGPSVAVVMSTYNGADHLVEQLESVLGQDVGALSVLVRDDGSSDGTLELLRSYASAGNVELVKGENLGVTRSFLDALSRVPRSVEYVALCDQDDVWHADKLSRALDVLEAKGRDLPRLYCSEYTFCDADMRPQGRSRLNRIGVDFPKMLFENRGSGNTMVLNRRLVDLVVEAGPDDVYCHDWWIALVATAVGELTYDDVSTLEYRRTGSNASPTGSGGLRLLRYRVRTFLQRGQLDDVTRQLGKLEAVFGERMDARRRDLLKRALRGGRLTKALTPLRLRQTLAGELALRVLFLAGLL